MSTPYSWKYATLEACKRLILANRLSADVHVDAYAVCRTTLPMAAGETFDEEGETI
jgi:hypothetical protein